MRRAFFICAAILVLKLFGSFCMALLAKCAEKAKLNQSTNGSHHKNQAGKSERHQTHINTSLPDHHAWRPAIDDIDERSVHKVPGLIAMRDKHAPKQARRSR
ncbi:hypothetical protein D3C72_1260680 [compost metagenome]|jgi:hypothetical protein